MKMTEEEKQIEEQKEEDQKKQLQEWTNLTYGEMLFVLSFLYTLNCTINIFVSCTLGFNATIINKITAHTICHFPIILLLVFQE